MRLNGTILAAIMLALAASHAAALDQEHGGVQLILEDLRTFTDVFNLVRKHYVDEVGDHELLDSALRGMVASLDPHSAFLSPEQARVQSEAANGRIGGIGIEVDVRDRRIYVFDVTPDGPAGRAGVEVGDMITAIDGRPVRGNPLRDSIDALRGEPGTLVEVTLQADPRRSTPGRGRKPRTLDLVREYIPVASVYPELLEDRFGYFRITHFHVGSANELQAALQALQAHLDGNPDGIILDLRGNGGGVIRTAIDIADGFLDAGLLVYTRGREAERRKEYFAQEGQWARDVPLAVLVDAQTASASEVLAGALQDHRRAVLIGEATFGKATVQTVLQLRNGSALKLTTARYYTPSGRSINETGIRPDIEATVASGEAGAADAALDLALDLLKRGES